MGHQEPAGSEADGRQGYLRRNHYGPRNRGLSLYPVLCRFPEHGHRLSGSNEPPLAPGVEPQQLQVHRPPGERRSYAPAHRLGSGWGRILHRPARSAPGDARTGESPYFLERVRADGRLLLYGRRQLRRCYQGLPPAHRQGARDAQMGAGLLAKPGALFHPGGPGGNFGRNAPPPHSGGQYRPGLAILEGR